MFSSYSLFFLTFGSLQGHSSSEVVPVQIVLERETGVSHDETQHVRMSHGSNTDLVFTYAGYLGYREQLASRQVLTR